MSYDFAKDNAAIFLDRSNSALDPDLPYVVYKNGEHLGSFKDYQGGVVFAAGLGILGECTIRDAFHDAIIAVPLSPMLQVIDGGKASPGGDGDGRSDDTAFGQFIQAVRDVVGALEARPDWSKSLPEKSLQRGLRAALDKYDRHGGSGE